MKIKYLVLSITDKCNLECKYCYMGQCGKNIMSREMISRAVSFLPEKEKCHVQITGGEPGLYPDLMAYAAEAVRKKTGKATVGVQTNGTLIGEEFISIVKKYGIQVGISIDGRSEINNFLRGKTNSVFNAMRALLRNDTEFRTTTVVTSINAEYIPEIPYILSAFTNARGMALDLLVKKGKALESGLGLPSTEDLYDTVLKLTHNLSFVNRAREFPIAFREAEKNRAFMEGAEYCHAARGESMAVSADGSIYPCGQVTGDCDFYCGNLNDFNGSLLKSMSDNNNEDKTPNDPRWDCPSRIHYNSKEEWTDMGKVFSMISSGNTTIH